MRSFPFLRPFALLIPFVIALASQAQEANFGILRASDISLTTCPFDKEANAVILLHEATASFNDQYNLITEHHVRMKVLKEKGIREVADINIPFYSRDDFEFISDVEAVTVNPTGDGLQQRQQVEHKAIFKQRRNEYWSLMKFTFPEVKVGSILDYKYRSTCKNYGALNNWLFQSELPVLASKFHLAIPPHLEFSYVVYKSSDMPIDIKKGERDGTITFRMENIPGLRDEPYMDALKDYIQRVEFQLSGFNGSMFDKRNYMTSWDGVIKELLDRSEFTGQLNRNLEGTDNFIKLVKEQPSTLGIMDNVYNYVRKNMTWNGVYSIISENGIKSAWNKKNGTSAEVNLILVNLLKAAGVEAYPMLVSERSRGRVNPKVPFLDQFHNTYAAVIIDKKKYYLDATDKLASPRMIPLDILNTTALIINRKAGGITEIKDETVNYQDNINVSATTKEEGQISGKVYMSRKDYARTTSLRQYKSKRQAYIDGFGKELPDIRIDSFTTTNEEVDSLPLQHNFLFSGTMNKTGDYIFIPINLFSGYETNPFIAERRLTDINFGYKQNVYYNFYTFLPAGYAIDALPKSVQMMNPDKTILFTRQLFNDEANNRIITRIRIDFNKTFYAADEYGELKEFYKKMFEMLNEPIVLRKK